MPTVWMTFLELSIFPCSIICNTVSTWSILKYDPVGTTLWILVVFSKHHQISAKKSLTEEMLDISQYCITCIFSDYFWGLCDLVSLKRYESNADVMNGDASYRSV